MKQNAVKMDKKTLTGHLLALATIIVWGSTFISSKVLLRALTPSQIIVLRFSIAYVVLWLHFLIVVCLP